jgi:hypothetical protein
MSSWSSYIQKVKDEEKKKGTISYENNSRRKSKEKKLILTNSDDEEETTGSDDHLPVGGKYVNKMPHASLKLDSSSCDSTEPPTPNFGFTKKTQPKTGHVGSQTLFPKQQQQLLAFLDDDYPNADEEAENNEEKQNSAIKNRTIVKVKKKQPQRPTSIITSKQDNVASASLKEDNMAFMPSTHFTKLSDFTTSNGISLVSTNPPTATKLLTTNTTILSILSKTDEKKDDRPSTSQQPVAKRVNTFVEDQPNESSTPWEFALPKPNLTATVGPFITPPPTPKPMTTTPAIPLIYQQSTFSEPLPPLFICASTFNTASSTSSSNWFKTIGPRSVGRNISIIEQKRKRELAKQREEQQALNWITSSISTFSPRCFSSNTNSFKPKIPPVQSFSTESALSTTTCFV